MKHYKVIFIDWDGTLSNSRFWGRWQGSYKYNLLQKVLFQESKDHLRLWMTGFISYAQVLRHVEARTGIPYKELEYELKRSAEEMNFVDRQVITLVETLRKQGTKVVIATDNMDTFHLWTTPALQLEALFDGILNSYSKGVTKLEIHEDGTSKFFHHYLSQNDIRPGEAVLIDNSSDAAVVNQCGIDFLHVNEVTPLKHHLKSLL